MNLRARLQKLEQALAAKTEQTRVVTDAELLGFLFDYLYTSAADREAISAGQPCELTVMGGLRPGAVQKLAARRDTVARLALKIRPWIEEQNQGNDTSARCYAKAILDGMTVAPPFPEPTPQ